MKEKFKKFLSENGLYYLIILLMMIAFCVPYFEKGLPIAYENGFHYARTLSLAETLKLGIFPAKIRPMLMMGFGYGVGFFYPDFFSYLPAVLILMGMEVTAAIKVQVILAAILGAIATFHAIDNLVDNKKVAIVTDILYFGTMCMWLNLFDGFGIGAFIAQVFLSMAFCGLIRAFRDEKSGYIEYAVGIVIVVLTHHLTFISMMVAMVMLVILNAGNIRKNPKILGKLFSVSIIGLLFTAQYWMPAMELAIHTKYKVIYDNYIDINDHILNMAQVITNITVPYLIVFVLAVAVFVYGIIKNHSIHWEGMTVLIVAVIHIYLMQSQLFWRGPVGQFFAFFQSTERLIYVLMTMILIFTAIVAVEAGKNLKDKKTLLEKMNPFVFILVCALLIIATRMMIKTDFYNPSAYKRADDLYPEVIQFDNGVSCGEWLPIENTPSECHGVDEATADDKTTAGGFKHDNYKYFEVWVLLDKKYYDVPYIYYYGYKAYLIDDDDNPIEELKVGEAYDHNGYVRVFMPEGRDGVGHLMVIYEKTTVQKIAYLITIATVIFVVCCYVYCKKKGKNIL